MVPLHGYRSATDLRSTNEPWIGGKQEMRDSGIYCGPGLWFDRATGRIDTRWHTTGSMGWGHERIAARRIRAGCRSSSPPASVATCFV